MKQRILVVDDEPGIRLLLTDLLAQEDFHVITATTGIEALNKLEEQSVELIILDYLLPVLTGAEVIKELKKNKSSTPLIIMSGLLEHLTGNLQTYDLIKGVISKPFHIQDMIDLVHSILR